MADAASFTDCQDSATYPVLTEGDHRAIEHAYLLSGVAPGAGLMVQVQGTLVQRNVEVGGRPRAHLLIQQFNNTLPDHDCNGPRSPEVDRS